MINEANIKKYLKNLIVDEAHIAIEWGDFFRVDYQCLEPWHNELLAINSQLRTVLLSATFTKVAVTKLKQMFASTDKWIEVRCDALRREPRYLLVKAKSYSDKNCKMIELVKKLPHPMVIYINSPKEAEEIKKTLVEGGLDNLETFTGNTKSAERERIIKDWADDKIDLIIATSAFGVGVDKGDVRTVLHLYVPDTPNQYYQELGRGGRDALWNFDNFPGFKIVNTNINSSLRDAIQKTGVSNEQFERMYLFMCVWGDATTNTYQEGERTFISGLSTNVYEDMGFPLISGKKITGKLVPTKPVNQFSGQSGTTMTVVKTSAQIAAEQKLQAERAQLNESLQAIENWIAGGTINVGATTGNVVLISKAREDMCNYLYSAIDWQAEGVSMDNIDKIKKVKDRLIGFDRQKRGADQMFYKLPADRETQTVIEAFLEWNVLGKRSWNFDEADRCVYRVQLWTEKIKKPLIEAITTFENREIDYFKCAMMAEFYRIILFGSSKATTVEGLKSEHILDNGIRGLGVNSHSDAWNSLLGIITRSENDKINRETVIQYCNVIQGESHAQVFLDREKFDAMVRNVKSERLTIEPAILDLVDPVKPRRDVRDYLRVILERLEKVQEDELAKADSIMATIKENFGTTDVDDEDIEDMVEKIVEFYRTAEDGKLPGKYDQELFDEVKKYSTSTSKAIKEIVVAQKTSNALDCIMAFSQDPIRKVEKLDQLLKKVTADIVKIQAELEVRKAKLGGGSNPSGSENVFENEKTIISECSAILESLEGAVC